VTMETSVERRHVTGRQDVDHDYVCIVMITGVARKFEIRHSRYQRTVKVLTGCPFARKFFTIFLVPEEATF